MWRVCGERERLWRTYRDSIRGGPPRCNKPDGGGGDCSHVHASVDTSRIFIVELNVSIISRVRAHSFAYCLIARVRVCVCARSRDFHSVNRVNAQIVRSCLHIRRTISTRETKPGANNSRDRHKLPTHIYTNAAAEMISISRGGFALSIEIF